MMRKALEMGFQREDIDNRKKNNENKGNIDSSSNDKLDMTDDENNNNDNDDNYNNDKNWCQDTLRQALAMGADKAVLLQTALRTDQELQPLAVAKLLRWAVLREKPSLVILGKQAIDGDNNQTGQLLAGLLQWPQATFASKLEIADDLKTVEVTREVDNGLQTISMPLPAVVTCDLRLNTPRYATLPNLMKAKKKPLEVIDVEKTGEDIAPRLEFVGVGDPPKRLGGRVLESVDELLDKLKNEAQVIT